MQFTSLGFAIDGKTETPMREFFWTVKRKYFSGKEEKRLVCVACDLAGKRQALDVLDIDGRIHARCKRCGAMEKVKQT